MPPRKRQPAYIGRHQAAEHAGDAPAGQTIPVPKPDLHAVNKPGETRGKVSKGKRRGPLHEAPTAPRKKAPPKAKPTSSAPTSSGPRSRPTSSAPTSSAPVTSPMGSTSSERRRGGGLEQAAREGHEYATRQAIRATTARPSVTGRAVSGGAAGAATGAALGGPVGAAVGGGAGLLGGAVSGASAKRAYNKAMRADMGARKAVVAEFAVCMVIVSLSPLTDKHKAEPPNAWMKRMTAVMGVFFILGLMSSGGRGMARFAAGFGALMTVALVVSERNLFATVGKVFATKGSGAGFAEKTGGIDDMEPAEPSAPRSAPRGPS